MSEEIEFITPPSSTSVAATSKAPLLEGFFYGDVNLELLEYPELDNTAEVNKVTTLHDQLKHFILQLDSAEIDQKRTFPVELLDHMSSMGLFGMDVDVIYSGLGLNVTQLCRAFEAIGLDGSLFSTLDAHLFSAIQLITRAGTAEQRARLLPPLASGSQIAALCHTEVSSGSDPYAITTKATISDDGKTYRISGQKTWVTNGAIADQLVVIAKLCGQNPEPKLTAFVVEKSSPGVAVGPRLDTFGLRASNTVDIQFDDVLVPAENLLATSDDIIKLTEHTKHRQQLCLAAGTVGLLRYLLSYASEHALQRHQFGRPIGDFQLIRVKLAAIASRLYAVEAGVFYLAGLWDAQPDRDLGLELSALKIFSSEALWLGLNECVQIMGRVGLTTYIPLERYLRDARCLINHGGTNEVLRASLATTCLQRCGPEVQDKAEIFRCVPRSPIGSMRAVWEMRLRRKGWVAHRAGAGPKVTDGGASRDLRDHLHPRFAPLATQLAHLTQRFRNYVEVMLVTNHTDIVDEQMILGRLSDCATDLLLSAVSMGRASRAISIGIHLHDFEITLASNFTKLALNRVLHNITYPAEWDHDHRRISSELLERQGYPVAHPLTRVW